MPTDLTPYSTAEPFFGVVPTWLNGEDADRVSAYGLYDAIYRNIPDAFKVIQRGSDQSPIYIPSAKTIIEAANRYLAKRWTFVPAPTAGTPAEQLQLSTLMQNTFLREQVYSKFATQKRYMLVRGDAIWHITADPLKDAGKRISIHSRDPGSYFPIWDPADDTKVVGCHLVDQFETASGSNKYVLRRQTYRKDPATKKITYEVSWWQIGGWDDRWDSKQGLKPADPPEGFAEIPAFPLPDPITSLPVYHVMNDPAPDAPFGTSELAGLERVIGGIHQAISDGELSLAMEGLGLYATTSGPPVDDEGNETSWKIGPGYVVELDQDAEWKRVDGVGSMKPILDHVGYLEKSLREASGTPDIAIGRVDVAIAESGVALQLEMAPLLAKNEEKEQLILSVMDHMLYDLSTMWFVAYEGLPGNAIAVSVVDDPMPVNRKAILEEIVGLLTSNLISIAYAQQLVSEKLGYEFPAEMLADIVTEQTALASAINTDPFATRVAQELQQQGQ